MSKKLESKIIEMIRKEFNSMEFKSYVDDNVNESCKKNINIYDVINVSDELLFNTCDNPAFTDYTLFDRIDNSIDKRIDIYFNTNVISKILKKFPKDLRDEVCSTYVKYLIYREILKLKTYVDNSEMTYEELFVNKYNSTIPKYFENYFERNVNSMLIKLLESLNCNQNLIKYFILSDKVYKCITLIGSVDNRDENELILAKEKYILESYYISSFCLKIRRFIVKLKLSSNKYNYLGNNA